MVTRQRGWALIAAILLIGFTGANSYGLEAENVLVIYNSASQDGTDIAAYYQQAHPGVHLLALDNVPVPTDPASEQVSFNVYLDEIRPQVLSALTGQIDCIVTTKGLPLRIDNPWTSGDPYNWNRYSSLESELARVDSISTRVKMGHQDWLMPDMFGGNELSRNPYHYEDEPFSFAAYGTRLTSRLDGFTVADVNAATQRAQRAVIHRPGYHFVLDDDPGTNSDRIPELRDRLVDLGLAHVYDESDTFVNDAPGPVLGYVSHGRHGGAPVGYILDTENGLQFQIPPGAVFHTYESYNACSFFEGANRYGQGLVAEWIHRGGTVGLGFVEEPHHAEYAADEDRLFEMLLNGYTWSEAAWNATMQLSFVNTVVGDPLMRLEEWTAGDVDLDGDVDIFDLSAVKQAYGTAEGDDLYNVMADMNADGAIDFWDLTYVKGNYTGPGGGAPGIPEPVTLSLLAFGACLPMLRRKR